MLIMTMHDETLETISVIWIDTRYPWLIHSLIIHYLSIHSLVRHTHMYISAKHLVSF